MSVAFLTFAIVLIALAAWGSLRVLGRLLPADFLAARMREQPPGTPPVRQFGGLVIVPFTLAGLVVAIGMTANDFPMQVALLLALVLLWAVGSADDRRHLSVGARLAAQFIAAGLVAFTIEPGQSVFGGMLPWWMERGMAVAALVWFVNMTNFMDGMDLMTVTGLGMPLLTCFIVHLADGPFGAPLLLTAGALVGFAVLNRPPASVFLGDNGSLPLGLLAGAVTMYICLVTGPVAAILPFGYYLADSLTTLGLRAMRGENLIHAHSGHAYQRARQAGRSQWWVAAHVAGLNVVLGLLMVWSAFAARQFTVAQQIPIALIGIALSLALVMYFRRQ